MQIFTDLPDERTYTLMSRKSQLEAGGTRAKELNSADSRTRRPFRETISRLTDLSLKSGTWSRTITRPRENVEKETI